MPHVSNHQEVSLPTLTSRKGAAKGRPPAPRQAPEKRNKMATSASPFHPSPLLPASAARRPYTRSPPRSHRKTKARLEGNKARGRRATAASRPYIPFEAMSAHARTGRQSARFQYHSTDASRTEQPRLLRRGLCTPPRLRMPGERTNCGKERGNRGRLLQLFREYRGP